MSDIDHSSGRAVVEDNAIVIRVPFSVLPTVVEGAWASGGIDTHMKITDVAVFAQEICNALNREEENGDTRIHQMFDVAFEWAYGYGAEGVEAHEEQEP